MSRHSGGGEGHPENPEQHDSRLEKDFLGIVRSCDVLARMALRDGFDPTPRPVPPELEGGIPPGHIAFQDNTDCDR